MQPESVPLPEPAEPLLESVPLPDWQDAIDVPQRGLSFLDLDMCHVDPGQLGLLGCGKCRQAIRGCATCRVALGWVKIARQKWQVPHPNPEHAP